MTVDWTAALVLLTGGIAICGAFSYITHLIVRAECAKLHRIFLPRTEAKIRDEDIDRRLQTVGL